MIEAGGKTLIGSRCKQSGLFWGTRGAEGLATPFIVLLPKKSGHQSFPIARQLSHSGLPSLLKTAYLNERTASLPGGGIDQAVEQLLVQSVTPLSLEIALNVQSEIQTRLAQADRLRQQQVQRTEYEADRARVRYMRFDPNNRLGADTLEGQWNEKLRLLAQAKEDCEKQQRLDSAQLTEGQKAKMLALATDFPRLWQAPTTSDRDRQRMARLLLEDVTLRREQEIIIQMRFKGGATHQLRLPLPKAAWALRKTKPEIVAEIDRLLDDHTEAEVAHLINEGGWHSSAGNLFTREMVHMLRRSHRLKTRFARLQAQGLATPAIFVAPDLVGVSMATRPQLTPMRNFNCEFTGVF